MDWPTRDYGNSKVNKAGEALRRGDRESVREVISNFRSAHYFPLNYFQIALRRIARGVQKVPKPIVVQRMKRFSSIERKLKAEQTMALSQMQDIGGCRAILANPNRLNEMIRVYEQRAAAESLWISDRYRYIDRPKSDGYRGFHFVVRYRTESNPSYRGLRIEIQLRTELQHAWATALETAETFTGHALRSSVMPAKTSWERFFLLMSAAIARSEKCAIPPNTPDDGVSLKEELRELYKTLRVGPTFGGWRAVVDLPKRVVKGAELFLMVLDPNTSELQPSPKVSVTPFKDANRAMAEQECIELEKRYATSPEVQVVLVRVKSLRELKTAYRNYLLDTAKFMNEVRRAIQ